MKESWENIVPGTYVSIWDGGIEVPSSCLVNLNTKEIFSIATVPGTGELEILEDEYLLLRGESSRLPARMRPRRKTTGTCK